MPESLPQKPPKSLFLLGSIAYDKAIWGQNSWKEWQEFNSPRAALSDYPAAPYQKIEQDNPNLLLSENDYYLALNWVTADPDVFNAASLSEIASSDDSGAIEKLANGFLPYLASFGKKGMIDPAYLFPIAAIIAFLYARRNGRIAIILSMLCCVACCSYFFGSGRMPDRVETPIWLYMALSSSFIAFASATASASTAAHSIHLSAPRRHPNLPLLATASTLIGGAVFAATLCAFLTKALLAFDPSIMHDAVRQASVEPNGPLYEYAMRDDGMINIWNTDACLYAEKEFKHRNLPNREYLLKNPCVGGWSSESPFIEAMNREIRMDCLLKGLLEKPNSRFICIDERHASAILAFLREHGYPQAQMKQVDSIFVDPAYEERDYLFNVYEYYEDEKHQ